MKTKEHAPGPSCMDGCKKHYDLYLAAPDAYRILSAIAEHFKNSQTVSQSALILDGDEEYLGKAIADYLAKAEGR